MFDICAPTPIRKRSLQTSCRTCAPGVRPSQPRLRCSGHGTTRNLRQCAAVLEESPATSFAPDCWSHLEPDLGCCEEQGRNIPQRCRAGPDGIRTRNGSEEQDGMMMNTVARKRRPPLAEDLVGWQSGRRRWFATMCFGPIGQFTVLRIERRLSPKSAPADVDRPTLGRWQVLVRYT